MKRFLLILGWIFIVRTYVGPMDGPPSSTITYGPFATLETCQLERAVANDLWTAGYRQGWSLTACYLQQP